MNNHSVAQSITERYSIYVLVPLDLSARLCVKGPLLLLRLICYSVLLPQTAQRAPARGSQAHLISTPSAGQWILCLTD